MLRRKTGSISQEKAEEYAAALYNIQYDLLNAYKYDNKCNYGIMRAKIHKVKNIMKSIGTIIHYLDEVTEKDPLARTTVKDSRLNLQYGCLEINGVPFFGSSKYLPNQLPEQFRGNLYIDQSIISIWTQLPVTLGEANFYITVTYKAEHLAQIDLCLALPDDKTTLIKTYENGDEKRNICDRWLADNLDSKPTLTNETETTYSLEWGYISSYSVIDDNGELTGGNIRIFYY